ncbi:MAG: diguanylate cyclase [Burkholderiales bacterium]|nr:diguanylate cyclase [Burkholderiales bacterium]
MQSAISWTKSFRVRLTLLFGALFLLTFMAAAAYVDTVVSSRMSQASGEAAHGLARSISRAISINIREREREVRLLAQTPTYVRGPLDAEDLRLSLERAKESYKHYAWIGVADTSGIVRASTGRMLQGESVAMRPWFQHGLHQPFVGDVHQAVLLSKLLSPSPSARDEPLRFVDFASPIFDDQGNPRGVLATHALWSWVEETIADFLPARSNELGLQVFIVDRIGNVLSPFDAVGKLHLPPKSAVPVRYQIGNWPDGGRYLYSEADIPGHEETDLGWRVIVRQPVALALATVTSLRVALMVFAALTTLVLMILVYRGAARFSKPVEQLAGLARRIEAGHEDVSLRVESSTTEMVQLTTSLTNMTGMLIARRQALEETNANLEMLVQQRTEAWQIANQALAEKADELARLARQDTLTALPNRMAANEQLRIAYERYRRQGTRYAVCVLDIDYFKLVNDTFGHEAGDRVLQHVTRVLTQSLRSGDFASRFGGEEFLLIVDADEAEKAMLVAEKVCHAIADSTPPIPRRVTASIGVSMVLEDDRSDEMSVHRADRALYVAKAGGRNRACWA